MLIESVATIGAIADFMHTFGYVGDYLGSDHENHWLFRPKELA